MTQMPDTFSSSLICFPRTFKQIQVLFCLRISTQKLIKIKFQVQMEFSFTTLEMNFKSIKHIHLH